MDAKIAAGKTQKILDAKHWTEVKKHSKKADGYPHICWMLRGIIHGYIQHEKAHRWLSWAQACIFCNQANVTLDTFKLINKDS